MEEIFNPPRTEAPGHGDTLEKHEEQQTHSTRGVLIKQLEHVDSSLEIEMFIVQEFISTRSLKLPSPCPKSNCPKPNPKPVKNPSPIGTGVTLKSHG